ncbi:MAG: sel1 repeat family protein [Alphaproteobacteria bacterium]|nr:sel1 repeat family protein [Alphaproteobacteria bacterium]MDE2492300.1 sel1 repeat family protein [Alphaproteobacteria bacterium]
MLALDYSSAATLTQPTPSPAGNPNYYANGIEAFNAEKYAEAARLLRNPAESGVVDAQLKLAWMYVNARGVPRDFEQALRWYRAAADRGNPDGENWVGVFYQRGWGTPKDDVQAAKWYRKAAEAGNSFAAYNLGVLYASGAGVNKDFGQAASWYRRAAEAGNSDAADALGMLYEVGSGVKQDLGQATFWYGKAAKAGNSNAADNLQALMRSHSENPRYAAQRPTYSDATQTSTDGEARATILQLLQQAPAMRVVLSDDEVSKLQEARSTDGGTDISDMIDDCNDNGYQESSSGVLWDTAETYCSSLGEIIEPEGGRDSVPNFPDYQGAATPNNPAAETAYARACALPIVAGVREIADGCVDLSRYFQRREQLVLALAVIQYAPKCQGKPRAEAQIHPIDYPIDSANSQLESCLWQEADVLRHMGRPQEEQTVYKTLCDDAALEGACSYLDGNGAQASTKTAEERQTSLQAEAQSRADADSAARAQARAEDNANFQNLMDTLHSLPGGSDPNAIVDTANQQAANMVALGTANDAARRAAKQTAAQQEQANAQQLAQTQQQAQQGNQQPNATASSPASLPSNPSPTPAAPQTSGTTLASAAGSGPTSANVGAGSCTDMNSFVTAISKLNPDGIAVGFLTNHSNQSLYVSYAFTRGGVVETSTAAAVTVQPGQTVGGEGGGVWAGTSGPTGVDSDPPRIRYSAWLQSEEDQGKNCKVAW